MDTQQAKTITLRYLIQKYGESAGLKIFSENQNSIFKYHGLAWALGKDDFKYFCEIFLHDFLFDYSGDHIPLSQKHYDIWEELHYTLHNRNGTRDVYIFPREFAKTSAITTPISIYAALYVVAKDIVILSSTIDKAKEFLSTIKSNIEGNTLINSCFGEIINKKLLNNTEEIELDIKPDIVKIKCASGNTSLRGENNRGTRIQLLILDDSQDPEKLETDEKCRKLVNRIQGDALKALDNNHNHVIAVGTVFRKGDLYDTLIHSPVWHVHKEKLIQLDDIDSYFQTNEYWQEFRRILSSKSTNENAVYDADDYYYENKEKMDFPVIWENYHCLHMAKEYFDNPVLFKRERQCDINNLGEKRITRISSIPAKDIESLEFTNTVLAVDPASTTNKKSDFSAFSVLSNTDNQIKYSRKLIIERLEFNDYIDKIIDLLLAYPDISTISIEKQTYSGADVIKLREKIQTIPELVNKPLNIINKARTKNKDARIDTIIPDINMGRIIFNEEDTAAIDQISGFAGTAFTAHDDAIDALTESCQIVVELDKQNYSYGFIPYSSYGYI